MWGILNTLNSSDVDEVTIDSGANWKATKIANNTGIKVSICHTTNASFIIYLLRTIMIYILHSYLSDTRF